ncbi:MAG: ABC transporter permease [Chloracidobacterium sp.]|nr:ABC transporter permease [Chloracidobacterium sp.]
MKLPLWRRRRSEEELEEEIQSHLRMAIRDRMERGESAEEAASAARREFGNVGLIKEATRGMWGFGALETFWQDLRYGARMLLKQPGFTFVAVITLALGIGANTAIFSVVNAVLLRPLPYEDPDRLVFIWGAHPQVGREVASLPDFADWREQSRSFERMAAHHPLNFSLTNGEEPERLIGAAVTADFFTVLRIQPALGRWFLPEEDRSGAPRVVILNHGLWQRRFNSNPDVLGRTITLNARNYTVVGIAPARFRFDSGAEFWVPLAMDPAQAGRRGDFLSVVARLKPGISLDQAQVEMSAISARLEQQYPQTNSGWRAEVVPLHEQIVGNSRKMLLVLLTAVGFVLLIACANVANLLLARATARNREIAVRAALGAGRGRLVRQLSVESILLALLGAAAGLLLAIFGIDLLVRLGPHDVPRLSEVSLDGRVLGFTALLSLATGALFGLAPAFQTSRLDLSVALKEGRGAGAASGARMRLRSALVVSEVALSLILLIGSGLMIKSLRGLMNLDAGFNRANLLTLQVNLPSTKYGDDQHVAAFYNQLIESVRALPGIVSATTVIPLPLSGGANYLSFSIAGRPAPPPEVVMDASVLFVGDRYIETMGIPIALGRSLTEQDSPGAPKAALINQTLARRYFPNQDPIGQRITLGDPRDPNSQWMTIVGMAADVKHRAMENEVYPAIYIPQNNHAMTIVARTRGNPLSLVPAVRSEVRTLDRDLPVYNIRTLDQAMGATLEWERFTISLLSVFAAVALTLAAVGLYGVMSYLVSQRTREIGIRMTLGARRSDVLMMVLGQGIKLTCAGALIGLGGTLALARLMKTLLFNVSVTDPMTFAGIALLLISVALSACWIPARRATKVDPMIAMRCD